MSEPAGSPRRKGGFTAAPGGIYGQDGGPIPGGSGPPPGGGRTDNFVRPDSGVLGTPSDGGSDWQFTNDSFSAQWGIISDLAGGTNQGACSFLFNNDPTVPFTEVSITIAQPGIANFGYLGPCLIENPVVANLGYQVRTGVAGGSGHSGTTLYHGAWSGLSVVYHDGSKSCPVGDILTLADDGTTVTLSSVALGVLFSGPSLATAPYLGAGMVEFTDPGANDFPTVSGFHAS